MKATLKLLFLLFTLSPVPWHAAADDLANELKELVTLLPGTYDNARQFETQMNLGLPENLQLDRRAQFFAHVERPKACCVGFTAGPEAEFFYMRIYNDGELWLGGEHIVVVYPDREAKQLVWQFVRIAEPERFLDLHLDVEKQRNVKLIPQPQDVLDCPVLGRKTGPNVFKAGLKNGGCYVNSRVSGNRRWLEMNLTLSPSAMLYLDRGFENEKVVHGSEDNQAGHSARLVRLDR